MGRKEKITKKEFPEMDNSLVWLCAVDYVLEEKGWKKDDENGAKMYEDSVKERKTFIYNTVSVEARQKIKLHVIILLLIFQCISKYII